MRACGIKDKNVRYTFDGNMPHDIAACTPSPSKVSICSFADGSAFHNCVSSRAGWNDRRIIPKWSTWYDLNQLDASTALSPQHE